MILRRLVKVLILTTVELIALFFVIGKSLKHLAIIARYAVVGGDLDFGDYQINLNNKTLMHYQV